ncbi:MAG: zf-TFIIB domain-containing protein [Proteobacteria bacterium]|nr:zf-TFIIB domain-containing protein [Pseudomonadota bacterium]
MPVKPSEREEEYFARLEFEQKKKCEKDNRMKMESNEKQRLKELHFMRCPKCGMALIEINYNEIAVDKCSGCDGIWLDAGEMEAVSKLNQGLLNKWFKTFKK